MTLYYYQYNGLDILKVMEDARNLRPSKIVIMGESEWEIPEITKELVDLTKELNIELRVVHGACKNHVYDEHYAKLGLPIENVDFWGTHWVGWTYLLLVHTQLPPALHVVNTDFKHKFISLNNRRHLHRCMFIDEMAKHDLLDKGVVSWINYLNDNPDYQFKYFDGKTRLLDDDFITKLDSFLIPKEWHESLLHVVVECTPHVFCISEKTMIPLLLKKPFVVLGAKGFNKNLADLGFQLFDEFIDYTFDDEEDLEKRVELYVKAISDFTNNTESTTDLYERVRSKVIHNFARACEIIKDRSLIPNSLVEHYDTEGEPKLHPLNQKLQWILNGKYKSPLLLSLWMKPYDFLTHIREHHDEISEIIVDNTVEIEYSFLPGATNGVIKVIELAEELNIPITLLAVSTKYNTVSGITDNENLTIVDSPFFWIGRTIVRSYIEGNLDNGIDVLDRNMCFKENTMEYLYITTNNLVKYHRCYMMDMLAKYELFDYGAIAWRDVDRGFDGRRPMHESESILAGYKFDYWKTPGPMYLDQPSRNDSFVDQDLVPIQYLNSFMQVVTESEHSKFFISEKTAIPLLLSKPFLVVGDKNFHSTLKDMGFELYDEIFDYSFDSIDIIDDRIEGVVKNLDRLKHLSKQELIDLHNKVIPKLQHNRNLAVSYAKELYPQYLKYLDKLENAGLMTNLYFLRDLKKHESKF